MMEHHLERSRTGGDDGIGDGEEIGKEVTSKR